MQIEISDPAYMSSCAPFSWRGAPASRARSEVVEVRVLWTPERPLSEAEQRAKVFGHLREWCADNPGVKANILS